MTNKLSKIYGPKKVSGNSEQIKDSIKQFAKITPSMLLLGALPTSSQAQLLSDAGLVCSTNQGAAACELPSVNPKGNIINASSTSFGVTLGGGTMIDIVQSFGVSSAGIDMDCDGDDEFQIWNGGVVRKWYYPQGGSTQVASFVGNYGVDFTNLSSGAAFGFDVTYNSPGGAIYGSIIAADCANSGFVSASDTFQGGVSVFERLNSAYVGSTVNGPIQVINDTNSSIQVGTSAFVPVEFDSNGNTHYGWVEVGVDSTRGATILNTSFNPTPDADAALACDACEIAPDPAIPTAGEWGLISLGLLLLSFGTTMIIRKEGVLATDQGNFSLGFNKPLFNSGLFKKAFLIALGVGMMLSIGSVVLTGTLTLTDIIGGAIATPILAYWLHLIGMYKNEEI